MEELELTMGIIIQKSMQELEVYIQQAVFKTPPAAETERRCNCGPGSRDQLRNVNRNTVLEDWHTEVEPPLVCPPSPVECLMW